MSATAAVATELRHSLENQYFPQTSNMMQYHPIPLQSKKGSDRQLGGRVAKHMQNARAILTKVVTSFPGSPPLPPVCKRKQLGCRTGKEATKPACLAMYM